MDKSVAITHEVRARCFFFQAEDGIRDLIVTGVQTCALPISRRHERQPERRLGSRPTARTERAGTQSTLGLPFMTPRTPAWEECRRAIRKPEIGRASCRERV